MASEWSKLSTWERTEELEEATSSISVTTREIRSILCGRCVHGVVFRRFDESIAAFCQLLGPCGTSGVVPIDLVECSKYQSTVKDASFKMMAEQAVAIDPRPTGGQYL